MPLPPLVDPVEALSEREALRTARTATLGAIGAIGQRRLRAAHVAVVGAGGLGSPVVLALASAGVGTLTVVDDDEVDATNLQRQVIHRVRDLGAPKVDSAVRAAADLAPETLVRPVRERLTTARARALLAGADVVVDGSDTFETREAVAAACERLGVPLVWGTVQGFDGQVTVFWSAPPEGAAPVRLSDLYPPGSAGAVPTCAETGVFGALCLQVGALMAAETVKLVTGIGDPLLGRVLVIDGLRARQREVPLRAASARPTGSEAEMTPDADIPTITCAELAERLADTVVLDVREADEVAGGAIPGSLHVPLAAVVTDPARVRGPVVIVCRAEGRSRLAWRALRAAGVEATVLAGGMLEWATAYPMDS